MGIGNFLCTDMIGVGILCDENGRIMFCDGVDRTLMLSAQKVQAIGTDEDTLQILVAEKGLIHVVE